MDLYGKLVRKVLFPTWEGVIRRRPTMQLYDFLEHSQWWALDELEDLQTRKLASLLSHAHDNVPFYRRRFETAGVRPEDITHPSQLSKLPVLDRDQARDSVDERVSTAPPLPTIRKTTSGTMGRPLPLGYNVESEYWRNAVRMRGYAWAGYRVGARSLHYWGASSLPSAWKQKAKVTLDRSLKRELYIDCTPRGDAHLAAVTRAIVRERPDVILTYAQAGAALARYINRTGARRWGTIPVLCGAERLFDADREALEQAFGPAVFETYGCREFMLIATECPAHDGLHVSMENLIVELVVREDGRERPAEPGEVGEVVITDLHNLGMPFIRYANGDLATARERRMCVCGRNHVRIGPIEGRVTETLRDGEGNPVSGLVFNILFCDLAEATRQFQAVQHVSGDVTLKLVPAGERLSEQTLAYLRNHCAKYLPGVEIRTEIVDDIPVSKSGKRQVVVVER